MTARLPQRTPNTNLAQRCPPPPGGWFGIGAPAADAEASNQRDIQWPQRDLDPLPQLLRESELPDGAPKRAALLARVRDGIRQIPSRPGPMLAASVRIEETIPMNPDHQDRHRRADGARPVGIDHRGVAVAIGRELNRARTDLQWTRGTAARRAGISTSTLDTNEAGIRRCSPLTLIKLGWSMAVPPPDLFELAMQRRLINPDKISLLVDLHAVAGDPTPPSPVRQWAIAHLAYDQHRHGVIRLPPTTVTEIACALEVKLATLIGYLARRAPYSVRGSVKHPSRTSPDPQPPDIDLATEVLAQGLGSELRDLRTERGWTAHDVVEQLPALFHVRTWYSYERGEVMSTLARLIEFGQLFNVPAPILLGRTLHRLGLAEPYACITGVGQPQRSTHAADIAPSQAKTEVEP